MFLVVSAVLAGAGACNRPLSYMSEGRLTPPACGYEQAAESYYQAEEAYQSAPRPTANASAEDKAAFAELGDARDTAERGKANAKECEDRARDWSDLQAQWQNSRAAINIADLADSQITLTIIEIVLLVATLAAGGFTLFLNGVALNDAEAERLRQEKRFESELQTAQAGMIESRRIAEQQTRAYVLPIRGHFIWPKGEDPIFTITYRNAGQTPAINVSECILFATEPAPPGPGFSRVFAERPIVGGAEMEARTAIPQSRRYSLTSSRFIGKRIADGGDVICYVYYEDVFGKRFRTGAVLSGDDPFTEGSEMELTTHFNDPATCFFFQELDEFGVAIQEQNGK